MRTIISLVIVLFVFINGEIKASDNSISIKINQTTSKDSINQTIEGKKEGYWIIYGKMRNLPDYKPDGIIEEGVFKSSRKQGLWKKYYPDGTLKSEIQYVNGRPMGEFKTYHPNGQVEEQGNWKGRVYTGNFERFYEDGTVAQKKVFNEKGKSILNQKGELVCVNPFPSMPSKFWNDHRDTKFKKAYFNRYRNIWHHGDYAQITNNNGIIISGRSDTTLNPGGVRLGTAEIYSEVERFKEIKESLVVGQSWDNDVRIILFVILNSKYQLDDDLMKKLKLQIRKNASPRHVPRKIIQINDIPRTKSGKIVELAVKNIIEGNWGSQYAPSGV